MVGVTEGTGAGAVGVTDGAGVVGVTEGTGAGAVGVTDGAGVVGVTVGVGLGATAVTSLVMLVRHVTTAPPPLPEPLH